MQTLILRRLCATPFPGVGNLRHTGCVQNVIWRAIAAALVVVTAIAASSVNQQVHIALLIIVFGLLLIQAPMDYRTHRLSRPVTYAGLASIGVAVAADSLVSETARGALIAVGVSGAVFGLYWLLHALSPRSLGWGDVLLVVPLALAIGYVAVDRVAVWQLLASVTGSTHAVVMRVKVGSRQATSIPFGPHLLFAAWLVLLVSV